MLVMTVGVYMCLSSYLSIHLSVSVDLITSRYLDAATIHGLSKTTENARELVGVALTPYLFREFLGLLASGVCR